MQTTHTHEFSIAELARTPVNGMSSVETVSLDDPDSVVPIDRLALKRFAFKLI